MPRPNSKGSILIVDDEKDLRQGLRYALSREGYRVACAPSAESALRLVGRKKPDAVILDVMFPGMDGIEFCRRLRERQTTPVLFLTARKSEADRVIGLRIGGDDYMTKPFSLAELLARVHALLRRARGGAGIDAAERIGELELDYERHEARLKGRALGLSPKEFDCLKALAQAKGRLLTKSQLLKRVWRIGPEVQLTTRTVDQHLSRLRGKLGCEAKRLLTVPRVGYRLLR